MPCLFLLFKVSLNIFYIFMLLPSSKSSSLPQKTIPITNNLNCVPRTDF